MSLFLELDLNRRHSRGVLRVAVRAHSTVFWGRRQGTNTKNFFAATDGFEKYKSQLDSMHSVSLRVKIYTTKMNLHELVHICLEVQIHWVPQIKSSLEYRRCQ